MAMKLENSFFFLGLLFIWSCFVFCLLFVLFYVISAPVLAETAGRTVSHDEAVIVNRAKKKKTPKNKIKQGGGKGLITALLVSFHDVYISSVLTGRSSVTKRESRGKMTSSKNTKSRRPAGLSYTGSEIINVHETKEQSEHNNT